MTPTTVPVFFQFEQDFVYSLRCIPMQVRYKLDTCGVKLKLTHWLQFAATERLALVDAPCETAQEVAAYRDRVQAFVMQHTGTPTGTLPIDPEPAWLQRESIPVEPQAKAAEFGATLDRAAWTGLTPLQRFALIKLSRPGHENKNFQSALVEFGLL
jgi:hypothetical protein